MNVLNIIERNFFLKELYPNGLSNFYMGRIELTAFDKLTLVLHFRERPAIEVAKWGRWGKDYNIITAELTGCMIKSIEITDWQNNQQELCECEVELTTDDYILLTFRGTDWKVVIELKSLLLQRNTVYME